MKPLRAGLLLSFVSFRWPGVVKNPIVPTRDVASPDMPGAVVRRVWPLLTALLMNPLRAGLLA